MLYFAELLKYQRKAHFNLTAQPGMVTVRNLTKQSLDLSRAAFFCFGPCYRMHVLFTVGAATSIFFIIIISSQRSITKSSRFQIIILLLAFCKSTKKVIRAAYFSTPSSSSPLSSCSSQSSSFSKSSLPFPYAEIVPQDFRWPLVFNFRNLQVFCFQTKLLIDGAICVIIRVLGKFTISESFNFRSKTKDPPTK